MNLVNSHNGLTIMMAPEHCDWYQNYYYYSAQTMLILHCNKYVTMELSSQLILRETFHQILGTYLPTEATYLPTYLPRHFFTA